MRLLSEINKDIYIDRYMKEDHLLDLTTLRGVT